MRATRVTLFALLLAALTLPSAAVAAGPPLDLEMVVPTAFAVPGSPDGAFDASGPAVDDGLICDHGVTYTLEGRASGWQSDRLVNFHVFKEFVCDDGSGSFFVKLEVRSDFTKTPEYNEFNWTIQGGTGDYEHLRGSGQGMGLYTTPDGVTDVYEGQAH